MQAPDPDAVIVRFGEIGVKSHGVRKRMAERLADNVRAMLEARDVPGEVERRWGRILVHSERADEAARAAADVFGVVSTRPAVATPAELDPIRTAAVGLAADHPAGATFAVRARRAGDREAHPFTSEDLEREVGAAVGEETGADVDLDEPDVTYRVEVRNDRGFVSVAEYDGPGGLPLGTQGRAVVLFSGGIDSPVAAWETMKRGVEVVPLYVDLGDYGGPDHRIRAVETARKVGRYAPGVDTRLRVVWAGDLVADLAERTTHTRMLSLRRAMLRMAAEVAADVGAHSIVTGESLGQKSSQTGENLQVTDAAVDFPVHRPLVTRDKPEIVARARELGTFHDATMNVGCERVAPDKPATRASLGDVVAREPDDLLERAEALAREREVVDDD